MPTEAISKKYQKMTPKNFDFLTMISHRTTTVSPLSWIHEVYGRIDLLFAPWDKVKLQVVAQIGPKNRLFENRFSNFSKNSHHFPTSWPHSELHFSSAPSKTSIQAIGAGGHRGFAPSNIGGRSTNSFHARYWHEMLCFGLRVVFSKKDSDFYDGSRRNFSRRIRFRPLPWA